MLNFEELKKLNGQGYRGYNYHYLKSLEIDIKLVLKKTEADLSESTGMCSTVLNCIPYDIVNPIFKSWKGFSGSLAYPIKLGEEAPEDTYRNAWQDKTMLKGQYGRSRKRLFAYTQKRLAMLIKD